MTDLRAEYERLIQETDRVLSAKRGMWLSAPTPEEALKWKRSIDESLDERLRLMKMRDAAQ